MLYSIQVQENGNRINKKQRRENTGIPPKAGPQEAAERKKTMEVKVMKMKRQLEKANRLEEGRKQFCGFPHPERRAYVWAGNISFPVPALR